MDGLLEPILLSLKEVTTPMQKLCENMVKIRTLTTSISNYNKTMDSLLQSIQMTSSCIEFPQFAEHQQIVTEELQNIHPIEENKDIIIETDDIDEEYNTKSTSIKQDVKKKTKTNVDTKSIKRNVDPLASLTLRKCIDKIPKKYTTKNHIDMLETILKYVALSKTDVSDIVNRFSLSILNCNEYLNVLIKTGDVVNKRSGNVSFYTLNPKKHKKLLSKQ